MSAPRRRPAQQPSQPPYPQYTPPYPQDPTYGQYGSAPWPEPQPSPFHPSQPYPSPDVYASANYVPPTAYPAQGQYASGAYYASPPALSYHGMAPAAFPHGGYLSAEYAASGDVSPSLGSHSSPHSPRPSAGRSRLNNFVLPASHGSPGLEAQAAHMSLAPLPPKPSSAAPSSTANSRPASGMANCASSFRPLSSHSPARSDIALRYPPLPLLPPRPDTPPALQTAPMEAESAGLDPSIRDYVLALRSAIGVYEQRDELLRLRTEAVGFQPKQAYLAWHSAAAANTTTNTNTDADADADADADGAANPILGVRLLQRLDQLQRENQELGRLLATVPTSTSTAATATATATATAEDGGVEELRREVDECHWLIDAMEVALGRAEARVVTAEQALHAACRERSTSILPSPPTSTSASASKASKPAEAPDTIKAPMGSESKPPSTPSRATPTTRKTKPGSGKPAAQRAKPATGGKNQPKSNSSGTKPRTNQTNKSPNPP